MTIVNIITTWSRPPFGAPNNRGTGPKTHRGVWVHGLTWTVWAACHADTRIIPSEHTVEGPITCRHCRNRPVGEYPAVRVSDLNARLDCWTYAVQAVDPIAKTVRAMLPLMSEATKRELASLYDDLRGCTRTTDLTPSHLQTFHELVDLIAGRIRELVRESLPDIAA